VLPGELLSVNVLLLEPIGKLLHGKVLELLFAGAFINALGLLSCLKLDLKSINLLAKRLELLGKGRRGSHLTKKQKTLRF